MHKKVGTGNDVMFLGFLFFVRYSNGGKRVENKLFDSTPLLESGVDEVKYVDCISCGSLAFSRQFI